MMKKWRSRFPVSLLTITLLLFFSGLPALADNTGSLTREEEWAGIEEDNILAADETESTETENQYEETPITMLRIQNLSPQVKTDCDYVDWWYSEWEDCHYLFLPSTADRSQLIITYTTEDASPLYLNGTEVVSGETTSLLQEADTFTITVNGTDYGNLCVMQSNLGCIYLSTSSGGLDRLDSNRNLIETGSALMLDEDGTVEYNGKLEKLTGHGNSSWNYSKKKSYNFKLPSKSNLYDMGKAKKWVLLSNYLDHSMLRNKVTMEMSRAAGMEYVMDSVFVDLYADGSYRGTYQLCERVQIQKNRVNIRDLEEETEDLNENDLDTYEQIVVGADSADDYVENSYKYYDIPNDPEDITGGYLIQFQLWNRYGSKADSGFVTSRGQAVEIDGPEYASEAQVLYIRNFVQELEDAIYSDTGYNDKGKHYSDYIDVDSLITAYLIQEISMNVDGTSTSFYLWKDSDTTGDGKLHCGPVWDFDLSYYNFATSRRNANGDVGYSYKIDNLFVAYFPISGYDEDLTDTDGSGRPTLGVSWVGQLYQQEDFVKRVAEIYFSRFDAYLQTLTDTEQEGGALITKMGEAIQGSAEMNNARWHMYGGREYRVFGPKNGDNFTECVDYVRQFIVKRKTWLAELWEPYLDQILSGDANADNAFTISDIVMLQKWLLGKGTLTCWQAVDYDGNETINVIDLLLMKRAWLAEYRHSG
jgi:hypothetical protein